MANIIENLPTTKLKADDKDINPYLPAQIAGYAFLRMTNV
jgi:hypothetical protein